MSGNIDCTRSSMSDDVIGPMVLGPNISNTLQGRGGSGGREWGRGEEW